MPFWIGAASDCNPCFHGACAFISPAVNTLDVTRVSIEISDGGAEMTTSGHIFEYTTTPVVRSVFPNHGPVRVVLDISYGA